MNQAEIKRASAVNMASISLPSITGKRNTEVWKANELKKLKELEEENRRLKQMFADLSLDHQILKDVLSGKI